MYVPSGAGEWTRGRGRRHRALFYAHRRQAIASLALLHKLLLWCRERPGRSAHPRSRVSRSSMGSANASGSTRTGLPRTERLSRNSSLDTSYQGAEPGAPARETKPRMIGIGGRGRRRRKQRSRSSWVC